MMQGMFTAKSAVIAQQRRLDTIANNLANINTTGFKASRADFKDTLYTTMHRPAEPQNASLILGSGVLVSATVRSFLAGTPIQTGIGLDFCLTQDGFFTVMNGQSEKLYTRDGSFAVSNEDGGRFLVTADGFYVLDKSGSRITLPEGDISNLKLDTAGSLSIGSEEPFATLGIAAFKNNGGLMAAGRNCFIETEASGSAELLEEPNVQQGFLESSNVDLSEEITKLIRSQRAFSFAATALTTADEMHAMANNMRSS